MTKRRLDEVRAALREEAVRRSASPRDVDLLLADVTGRSAAWVIAHGEELVDAARVEALLERRWNGEPLQYLRGRTEFYGREFLVDERVLIPRPETEILVETALKLAPRGARVIDIGTGSGCIAITLQLERPDLRVLGVDRSIDALALAAANARRLTPDASFAASDVLTSVRRFDFIVSNPPYIPAADVETLATEVRDHEPRAALTPGPRGTEVIERILDEARGVPVILEIGFGQESAIRDVAAARGYAVERVVPDLAGIPRVVVLSAHAR